MLLIILLFSAITFPAEGLERRVEFWKSVFTKYGEDHLIFHDRKHVHLIYEVVDLKAKGILPEDRERRLNLEAQYRDTIITALTDIATRPPAVWSDYARTMAKRISDSGVHENANVLSMRIHVQRGIREKFAAGLQRYSTLGGTVERILREEGIPEYFSALPLVESSYLNVALSRTGAAGVWQFMPSTAKEYMKVTAETDQRFDLHIATRAAARLLQNNYSRLGDWPLAITAYNHGLSGMKRAKENCGTFLHEIIDCYDGPLFGYASSNFYAEFLAAVDLLDEHRKGLEADAARRNKANHLIPNALKYQIREGDTLLGLSKKFRTTPERIMVLNGIERADRLIAGRFLLVPKG